MKELSMHVYDLMENATEAQSTVLFLNIEDLLSQNLFRFTIEDNGKGMSPEFLSMVADPYTTSRTTRKVGLGIPLVKMNCERCDGGMLVKSQVGKGTVLTFWFRHDHWDRPPMGDLPGDLVMFLSQHEDVHIVVTYTTDNGRYVLDSEELKEALDGMSMNDNSIIRFVKEMVAWNLVRIGANE